MSEKANDIDIQCNQTKGRQKPEKEVISDTSEGFSVLALSWCTLCLILLTKNDVETRGDIFLIFLEVVR